MLLTFQSDKATELSFKVGIAGTQTPPSKVDVVLERDSCSLTFNAVERNGEWVATIDKPGNLFGSGEVKFSINVLLSTRLFTPFKSTAMIETAAEQAAPEVHTAPEVQATPPPEELPPSAPTPELTLPITSTEQEFIPPPVKTEDQRMEEARAILEKARVAAASAKKKTPTIQLGILKAVEPAKKSKPKVDEAKTKPGKSPEVFNLKKTKVVVR